MRAFKKALAVVCVMLMTATAFQVASAKVVSRDQWDYVVDDSGWIHGVFVMPYSPGPRQPMNSEVFYIDNVGGAWNEPIRISDSLEKSSYPQIDIDTELGIIYVTWLEDGPRNRSIWYSGSADGLVWTTPHPSGEVVNIIGNPSIEMTAEGGVIELSWRSYGSTVIVADLDFDMIPDYQDERILDFDIDIGMPFEADLVEYSAELGVVVALDFISGTGTVSITPTTPATPMAPSSQDYFEVTFAGSAVYTAVIKASYDPASLPSGIEGKHLRMYWLNDERWRILMDEGEDTGVDTANNYVWATLDHLSTFVIGYSTIYDTDTDGISDGTEINAELTQPITLPIFGDGSLEVWMNFSAPGEQTTYIEIPIENNTLPNVEISWLDIEGTLEPFIAQEMLIASGSSPAIWGDKLAWRDYDNNLIMLKDLSTGEVQQVSASNHSGIDGSPVIWGDWVAWVRETPPPAPYPNNSSYTLMAWNDSAKQEIILGGGSSVDIWGDKVVGVTDLGIAVYDLDTFDVEYIGDTGYLYSPEIWNQFLAYYRYVAPSNYAVELYDFSTGAYSTVATGLTYPLIDLAGTKIAYANKYGAEIAVYDVITGETLTVPASANGLVLSEDWLYWVDGFGALFGLDLWTRETVGLGAVEDVGNFDLSADMDRLVWSSGTLESVQVIEQGYRQIVEMRVGDQPTPVWSSSGWRGFNGTPEMSYLMNTYIRDNFVDGVTSISIPIKVKSYSSGSIVLREPNTNVAPIVTDPVALDGDGDGLADGWVDKNANMVFDAGDTPGEWQLATDPNSQNFVGTSTSRAIAGEVDALSGNLRLRRTLLSVGAGSGRISFEMAYNSQLASEASVLGMGWGSPFFASVTELANGNVEYRTGEGETHLFKLYASTLYSTPPGFVGNLARDVSGAWYLSYPGGAQHGFLPDGKLYRMEDRNGRGIQCSYDAVGNLVSIAADGGTILALTYDVNGYLAEVSDELGRWAEVGHDASGALTSLIDANQNKMTFAYSSDWRLLRSVASWGLATEYTYNQTEINGPWRVIAVVQGEDSAGVTLSPATVAEIAYAFPEATEDVNAENGTSATEFDDLGGVTNYTDPSNITTTSTNDYNGQSVAYVDGNGERYNASYDADGNMVGTESPLGATMSVEYFTYPNGYRALSLSRRDIAENGALTRHWYDSSGNEVRDADPARVDSLNWYDAQGRLVETRDARGARTIQTYDSRDNVLSTTDALGGVTSWTYDLVGRRISETDANGFTHNYTYTDLDQVGTVTDPFGFVEYKLYDKAGNLVSERDKKGYYTNYTYDVFGRKLTDQDKLGYVTSYAYDALGRMVSTTNARGYSTNYTYDDSSRMIATIDARGYATSYGYDNNGNQISQTNPLGNTWSKTYDSMNRVVSESDPLGNSASYAYDLSGNLIQQTDAMGYSWSFEYDEQNRKVADIDPLGAATRYAYDEQGNLVAVTDANGHTWTYRYDLLNRKVAEITPLGYVWSFGYDAVGNQISRTDANGATTTYQYCALNRVVRTNYPDGTYIVTGYNVCYCDPTSEIYYAADGTVVNGVTKTIDALGRPVAVTTNYGTFTKTVSYTYDAVGNVLAVSDSDGRTIQYGYDANNRVRWIGDSLMVGVDVVYFYDAAGRVRERTLYGVFMGYDARTEYAYDAANRLTSVYTHIPLGFGPHAYFSYQYDANGRRTSMYEYNGPWSGWHNYTYDAAGRLAQVSYPWSTVTYTYDAVGNRMTETEGIYQKNYAYDDENRLVGLTFSATKPYVYPIHTYAWEYDGNGNQIAQTVINGTSGPYYSYDYENRLTNVRLNPDNPGDTNVSYAYLPNGDRIKRANATETTYFLYDREDVIAILNEAGIRVKTFTHGFGTDEPIALKIGSNIYYYAPDGLGSIAALITHYSVPAAAYRYDAWGNVVNYTDAGGIAKENPYLFTGREYDWQTGIYYYRARSYDAVLGRFLQRDPAGMVDGTNMYAYVGNDPVNKIDPNGKKGCGWNLKCWTCMAKCSLTMVFINAVIVGSMGLLMVGLGTPPPVAAVFAGFLGIMLAPILTIACSSICTSSAKALQLAFFKALLGATISLGCGLIRVANFAAGLVCTLITIPILAFVMGAIGASTK